VSGFRTIATTHHYRGFSSVRVDVLRGTGGEFTREVVEHPDAVAVVALDGDCRVALVRQYRHPLGRTLLEIPAGTLDVDGEAPDAAAHRELAEEVGLATDELIPLGEIWNSAGWSDERTILFLARTTRPTALPDGFAPEDEEAEMAVEWRPLEELVQDALEGRIEDAKTVIGALRAQAHLGRGFADAEG
jgi:8-oxo-dGDP phosphatase